MMARQTRIETIVTPAYGMMPLVVLSASNEGVSQHQIDLNIRLGGPIRIKFTIAQCHSYSFRIERSLQSLPEASSIPAGRVAHVGEDKEPNDEVESCSVNVMD